MADPMGPLLDQDEEEALSPPSFIEGRAASSPSHSFSSYASSPVSFSSPPPSPPTSPTYPLFVGTKAREDPLSFPWFSASDLLDADVREDSADDGKGESLYIYIFFLLRFVLGFLPLLIGISEDRQESERERRGETCSKGHHERDSNTRHAVRPDPIMWPGPLGQRAPHTLNL